MQNKNKAGSSLDNGTVKGVSVVIPDLFNILFEHFFKVSK